MHFPSHVHTLSMSLGASWFEGGYEIMALVSKFRRLGNLLKPNIGLALKVWVLSEV